MSSTTRIKQPRPSNSFSASEIRGGVQLIRAASRCRDTRTLANSPGVSALLRKLLAMQLIVDKFEAEQLTVCDAAPAYSTETAVGT